MGKDATERLYTEADVRRLIAMAVDQATRPLRERIDQLEADKGSGVDSR